MLLIRSISNLKERGYLGGLGVDGRIKCIWRN